MTSGRLVLRRLAQRRLASALTGLSVALGTALVAAILLVERQGRTRFDQAAFGYELIVGARGSAVQLVLNTVYHLDRSPGNIPAGVLEELRADRRVRLAVPIAVGDAYRGFRVVAARRTGLSEGSRFSPAHGLEAEGAGHEEEWTVWASWRRRGRRPTGRST